MSTTTLTVRADPELKEALERRAEAEDRTLSALVRQILEEAVAERPLASRVGHLKGKLEIPPDTDDPWRQRLRERNWRS